jgi:hypothetical protein
MSHPSAFYTFGDAPEEIASRRSELFGNAIPAGRNPTDVWTLSVDRL